MLNSLSPNFALSKLFIGFIKRLRIVTFSVRNSNLLCSSALDSIRRQQFYNTIV